MDTKVRLVLVLVAIFYRKKWVCIKCTPCNAASCDTYRFLLIPALQASSLKLMRSLFLMHNGNNAPAYTSLLVRSFFGQYQLRILQTWPFATFSCFQNWKDPWNCGDLLPRKFRRRSSRLYLNVLHQKCFEEWKKLSYKCIISEEDYFKRHNIDIDK